MAPRRGNIGRLLLLAAIVVATWPAWRVLTLGGEPTIDELLQLRCFGGETVSAALRPERVLSPVVSPAVSSTGSP